MSGTKIALAQPHSFQSGALSFISCTSARESSPLDENDSLQPTEFKAETKKKRFHPLRNLRRMFRRKSRRSSTSVDSYPVGIPDNSEIPAANLEHRSCSTSRLQEENVTHNLMKNSRLNPGLSLSHDSIFTPDRTDSGLSSSDLENSSLSITVLTPPSRDFTMKSQSSCSETSLLSLGSSEVELSPSKNGKLLSDLDLGVATYKLSHSAAKHKMAVKPKRKHGAPRNRRKALTSKSPLPTTVEVSEEGAVGQNFSIEPLEYTSCSPVKITIEPVFNDQDTKLSDAYKEDEEVDGKEEENAGQKQESFFGRFLYRRSEKKKKVVREHNSEELMEEKCSQMQKKVSRSTGKTPNQRQRVEPVEIPASPLMGTNAFRGQRDGKGVISSSVSPPKNNWPSQVLSRSTSPPKVIWPEDLPSKMKKNEDVFAWDQFKSFEINSTKNVLPDLKNPDFMKELTDSVVLFGKDEIGKRKKDEEDGDIVLKLRRQHSENEFSSKIKSLNENSNLEPRKSDAIDAVLPRDEDLAKEEPQKIKCRSVSDYSATHEGYENIQIIEKVKKEMQKKSITDEPMEVEKKFENKLTIGKPIITDFIRKEPEKSTSEEMKEEEGKLKNESEKLTAVAERIDVAEPEIVRKVKPVISEKPKDLRKSGAFDSSKIDSNKMEAKSLVNEEVKIIPRTRSTLVERRKSELFLLTEVEEKNWKAKVSPVKKQASFKETTSERLSFHESLVDPKKEEFPKKTEPTSAEPILEEVIFRKKSIANNSDDQPELMKVFARRSLKVKESEKLAENLQKSRDSASDKENETVDNVKERKAISASEEIREAENGEKEEGRIFSKGKPASEVKVNITPLKPEVMSRKGVLHRYGRSLSEINAKKEESDAKCLVLEESKNRNSTESTKKEDKHEKKNEEEEKEGGFKRIQQRKAEWERRAQQSAK